MAWNDTAREEYMREINCAVRSKGTETRPSKSSSDQIVPKVLNSCPEDGSSNVPLPGLADAAALPKTGSNPSPV